MAKKYKTKKPTGLAFARKGNAVTLSWKCGDSNYDAQQQMAYNYYGWKFKYDTKKKKNIGNTQKDKTSNGFKNVNVKLRSYVFKFDPAQYYPNKNKYLMSISASIRGKRKDFKQGSTDYKCQMSDYTNLVFKPLVPSVPKLSAALSDTYSNQTTFNWSCPDTNTSARIFYDYAWQTVLVKNCNYTDGSKAKWSGATLSTGKTTSKTIREDQPFSGYYSWTRWFRVRSRGARGASAWKYAKHVYAIPAPATEVTANVNLGSASRGYLRINVLWTANATVAHPIDRTTVEYLMTTPASTVTTKTSKGVEYSHTELTPVTFSGGTEATTIKDSPGKDGVVITVPTASDLDNCVVVRVNTYHDSNVYTGASTYVKGSYGLLSDPDLTSIGTVDPVTKRVQITISNNSSVPNVHHAIMYISDKEPGKTYNVGIIPAGQTSATITLPDSCLTHPYKLGVKTRLGDYSPATPYENRCTYYTLSNNLMSSNTTWGEGSVPQPPQNVELTSPSTGTIRVSWDWSWTAATGAELSWSDHRDAWESTDEPSTYVVNNTNAGAWNISGLNIGTWYVRVRLFKASDVGTSYSSYSDIKEIKIASAPDTPSLTLSDSVISDTGQVTCYWVYTTNDGTSQSYAEICEATYNSDGTYTYGEEPIAHTNTTQYLTLYAEELGWQAGEIHYLAVRVTSASGETSENWSTPVPIAIANKIDIVVKETSLVDVIEPVANEYILTSDPEIVTGKTYYTRSGEGTEIDPYVYTAVQNPESNPSEAGYYEQLINTYKALTEMPLTVSVDNAEDLYVLTPDTEILSGKTYYIRSGTGTEEDPYIYTEVPTPASNPQEEGYYEKSLLEGDITLIIERAEDYHMSRPDESEFDGYKGETISIINKENPGNISFERSDLMGVLDDGAKYNLIATVTDSYGQTSTSAPLEFIVKWAHQAVSPSAELEAFDDRIYVTILPTAPVGYEITPDTEVLSGKTYYTRTGEGTEENPYIYTEVSSPTGNPHGLGYYQAYNSASDTCDIYRLSVDAPVLIYKDASFGTKYVDPYPTIQKFGGYRIVYRTVDGDYITVENNIAWTDYMDEDDQQINVFATIIDFSKERIILPYDIELSNKWSKDFTETKYLGGSVQGDWNPAVSRTGTVKTNTIVFEDPETIKAMRRLAEYPGICHIRTPDGSNYTANINVNEDRENKRINQLAKFSLDITRVDPEDLDGETYDSWISENE